MISMVLFEHLSCYKHEIPHGKRPLYPYPVPNALPMGTWDREAQGLESTDGNRIWRRVGKDDLQFVFQVPIWLSLLYSRKLF